MPRFTLTVELDNAAFQPDPVPEVARLLRVVTDRIEGGASLHGPLRDHNGNAVGRYAVEDDTPTPQQPSAEAALDRIHAQLSGVMWSAQTIEDVASIVEQTGRRIAPPE